VLNSELFSENSYPANVFLSDSVDNNNETALAEEPRDWCAWHLLARPRGTSSSPGCSRMSRCPGCTAPRSSCPLRKEHHVTQKNRGIFLDLFLKYYIQHCFICRPLDSTVSEDAGIEPRTVATLPDYLTTRLDLIRRNISLRKLLYLFEALTLRTFYRWHAHSHWGSDHSTGNREQFHTITYQNITYSL
jgi:hypothetical protein